MLNANSVFFQFQVVHQTIMTNKKLYQFNVRNDNLCEDCQALEDIPHLLYDCPEVSTLCDSLQRCLSNITNTNIHFDRKSVLLGNKCNSPVVNTVVSVAKHELYKQKFKGNVLSLNYLKRIFQRQLKVDIYLGTIIKTLHKVLGKWSSLYKELHNL